MSFDNYRKIIINAGNDFTLYFSGSGSPIYKFLPAIGGVFDARINQSELDNSQRGLFVTDSGSAIVDIENLRANTTIKLDLKDYSYQLIEEVLNDSGIDVNEQYSHNVYNLFTNPSIASSFTQGKEGILYATTGEYPSETYQLTFTDGDKIITAFSASTGEINQIPPLTSRVVVEPFQTDIKLPVRAKDIATDDLVIKKVVTVEEGGDTGSLSRRIGSFDGEGNIASPILFKPGGYISDGENYSISSGSGIELLAGNNRTEIGKNIGWVSPYQNSGKQIPGFEDDRDPITEIYTYDDGTGADLIINSQYYTGSYIITFDGNPIPISTVDSIRLQISGSDKLIIKKNEVYSEVTGSFPKLNLRSLPSLPSETSALVINGSNEVGTRSIDVTSYTSGADNRILTSTGTNGINGEENLTFDGSTLILTGSQTTTVNQTIKGNLNVEGNLSTDELTIKSKNIILDQQSAGVATIIQNSNNASNLTLKATSGKVVLDGSSGAEVQSSLEVQGDLVITGKITAEEYHTELVSSSIIYKSGSTKFGDTSDDIHEFTGSVKVDGIITSNNSLYLPTVGSTIEMTNTIFEDDGGAFTINTKNTPEFAIISPVIALQNNLGSNFFYATGSSIGLGTSNPNTDYKLDVNGNVNINGSLNCLSNFDVTGNSTVQGTLDVTDLTTLQNSIIVTGSVTSDLANVGGFRILEEAIESILTPTSAEYDTLVNGGTTYAITHSQEVYEEFSSGLVSSLSEGNEGALFSQTNKNLVLKTTGEITGSDTLLQSLKVTSDILGQSNLSISGSTLLRSTAEVLQDLTLSSSLHISGALYDSKDSKGTPDQVLFTTSTGIEWRDNIAQEAQDLVIVGKNLSGGTVQKGTPLYFTGSGTSGNIIGIYPADAGNPDRMPAGGVAGESIDSDSEGSVYIYGFISGVDTSQFNAGDDVFVKVGGGYTNLKPTGSALIQKLGNVEKVSQNNGSGVIQGPSWYNDLPNWEAGKVKVGRSDGQPVTSSVIHLDETNGRVGIGTSSPSEALSVDGNISGSGNLDIQGNTINPIVDLGVFNSDQNNLVIGTGTIFTLKTTQTFGIDITGISGGVDGRLIEIINVGLDVINFTHDDSNSTAGNRFYLPRSSTVNLDDYESFRFRYVGSLSRWVLV